MSAIEISAALPQEGAALPQEGAALPQEGAALPHLPADVAHARGRNERRKELLPASPVLLTDQAAAASSTAAAATNGVNHSSHQVNHSEYPQTLAMIRKFDPAVDEAFVRTLVQKVSQHCLSHPKFPKDQLSQVGDKAIAMACKESFATGPPKHRAGLLLSRVPNIIVTWAMEE